jgi:hypothetical protein
MRDGSGAHPALGQLSGSFVSRAGSPHRGAPNWKEPFARHRLAPVIPVGLVPAVAGGDTSKRLGLLSFSPR